MKSITTLVKDIHGRLTSTEPYDPETVEIFAQSMARKLADRLSHVRKPGLSVSGLGTPCDRKLWFSINTPEDAEPLSATTRLKFLLGDVWEEILLFLAAASGHRVEKEQMDVTLHGVPGHIDAVIDGELVDVKSASTFGFKKFQEHRVLQDDPFGYATQLGGYLSSLSGPDDDVNPNRAHFLAGEKTNGYLCLDSYNREDIVPEDNFKSVVEQRRKMLSWPNPPARAFLDKKDGESGNMQLGLACSYCQFKGKCWPGLRAFKYSKKPRFLTKVVRLPDVPEISLHEAQED